MTPDLRSPNTFLLLASGLCGCAGMRLDAAQNMRSRSAEPFSDEKMATTVAVFSVCDVPTGTGHIKLSANIPSQRKDSRTMSDRLEHCGPGARVRY